ncbi:MAG TPA: CHRD domain-containing protein [Gemmatimonadaceae bacterium]|nr:CHRD domain-containing protein [Gemmatimonadaceae bacterium]
MRCVHACVVVAVVACADGTPTNLSTSPLAPSSSIGADAAPPTVFNVTLRAENEPNGASTSTSKGSAHVMVFADGTIEFLFSVNNKSGETYNRAHIHKAAAGVNGPIHWDFLEAGNPVASLADQPSQLRGVARPRTAAVLADLLANPELYYVNVHSTAFPGGAVRGQLR